MLICSIFKHFCVFFIFQTKLIEMDIEPFMIISRHYIAVHIIELT